jgi:hypothetical protein
MPTTRTVTAIVSISETSGTGAVDSEFTVRSLEELFEVCRQAQASHVVRITLTGPEGEAQLSFASFLRK